MTSSRARTLLAATFTVVIATLGCQASTGGSGGPQGSGGSGGQTSSGSGSGGASSNNGSGGAGSGGASGSGGRSGGTDAAQPDSGGLASGGSVGTGGVTSTGGSGSSSGGAATGGVAASGGTPGGGGATATGGAGAAGGSAGGHAGRGGSSGRGGGGLGGSAAGGGAGAGTGGSSPDGGADAAAGYRPCPSDGSACKIMPFGDSITDGYNQDTPGGYRVELFRLAHAAGKNLTFVGSGYNGPDTVDGASFPHNHEGHSGWTIAPAGGRSGISTLVSTVMPQYKPNIVLLMIGTNDAIDNYDTANAPNRLGALIDSIYAQLPTVLIIVAQPIPSRGDSSKGDDAALSSRIKAFDDAIPAVVKTRADAGKHILVVDMFTPFNTNKASLIEDQWHPNLKGYVLLGTQWYSVLQPLL